MLAEDWELPVGAGLPVEGAGPPVVGGAEVPGCGTCVLDFDGGIDEPFEPEGETDVQRVEEDAPGGGAEVW